MGELLKFIGALIFFVAIQTVAARDLDKLYKKHRLKMGAQKFSAFIADSEDGRAQGLMFIEKIPENTGMLFVFDDEHVLGFWMKNTLIPLSIGFFDKAGVLIDVQEMKVANSLLEVAPPAYQSQGSALFALEMNAGWFAKHNLKPGARLDRMNKSPSALLNQKLPLPTSLKP